MEDRKFRPSSNQDQMAIEAGMECRERWTRRRIEITIIETSVASRGRRRLIDGVKRSSGQSDG